MRHRFTVNRVVATLVGSLSDFAVTMTVALAAAFPACRTNTGICREAPTLTAALRP